MLLIEKNNKKYIEGYFDKFVTDLDEARDYERRTGDRPIFEITLKEGVVTELHQEYRP